MSVMVTGTIVDGSSAAPAAPEPAVAAVSGRAASPAAGETPIGLQLPDGTVAAVLDDSPVAQRLVAALPLRLRLHDPMGQAKSGRLPLLLDTYRAVTTLDPDAGGIYYWPPSGDIAIYYDDLGQTVPPPGLVRLGTITGGLARIESAGRRADISIVPV